MVKENELKIRICNINGADVIEWFRYYDEVKKIGHVEFGDIFDAELRYYMDTSVYYKINYNNVCGYIYSGNACVI